MKLYHRLSFDVLMSGNGLHSFADDVTCKHGMTVLAPSRNGRTHAWPHDRQRRHARIRHIIVEIVHGIWMEQVRLSDGPPHTLDGVLARFAAMAALCMLINRSLGRSKSRRCSPGPTIVRSSLLDDATGMRRVGRRGSDVAFCASPIFHVLCHQCAADTPPGRASRPTGPGSRATPHRTARPGG